MAKRFLILISLCFFCSICLASQQHMLGVLARKNVSTGVADHCASGCTGTDCDVVCVDAETGVAECTFSDTDGGAASSITWNASHTGSFCCTDKGSYAVEITFGDTETTYSEMDMGVSKVNLYGQFYFLVHSETLADTETQTLFRAYSSGGTSTTFAIRILDSSGTLYLQSFLNQTVVDYTSDSTKTISLDTWYMVRFRFQDEVDWFVSIADCNGDNSDTVEDLTEEQVDQSQMPYYIVFGQKIASVGTVTVQLDNIKVDDDTAISSECTQ